MPTCKYCGIELENNGFLTQHYKKCPENPKNQPRFVKTLDMTREEFEACEEISQAINFDFTPHIGDSDKFAEELDEMATCDVEGKTFVLVNPDEYQRLTANDKFIFEQANIISDLQGELAKKVKIDAEKDGTIFWPISRLPQEISLLAQGQYLSLQCTGRINGDKIEIDEVKML